MKTRVFKSGNSQAVRIPAEIAYEDVATEFEIMRSGDVITIRPTRQIGSMREAIELLQRMPKPETIEVIERTQTRPTPWDED